MLSEILGHINNYFVVNYEKGGYEILEGGITLPFIANNQHFLISGSIFNDGVYKYPASNLTDETFTGTILALAIPPDLVKLADEIKVWQDKNGNSPYLSESFGGYTYNKAIGKTGSTATWQETFAKQLNRWRKL